MPELKDLLRSRKKQKSTDDVVKVDRSAWNERRLAEATPHGVKLIEDEGLKYPDPASRKGGRRKGTRGGAGGRLLKFVCSCEPEAFIVRCYKPELMALCLTCKAPFRLDESSIPKSSTLLRGKQGKHESKADLLKVMREEGLTLAVKKEPLAPLKAKKWVDALKEALEKVQSEIRHAKDLDLDYDPQEPLTDDQPTTEEYEEMLAEEKREEKRQARHQATAQRKAQRVKAKVDDLKRKADFFGSEVTSQEIAKIEEEVDEEFRPKRTSRKAKERAQKRLTAKLAAEAGSYEYVSTKRGLRRKYKGRTNKDIIQGRKELKRLQRAKKTRKAKGTPPHPSSQA